MKDSFLNLYENLKERLKGALQAQQESELYLRLKEKYESLPYTGQKAIKFSGLALILILILWLPFSFFTDSMDLNSHFEERRQSLKDILKLQRDFAAVPAPPVAPAPMSLKGALDQKIISHGVTQEQIKEVVEDNGGGPSNVEQKGIGYTIQHVTIRQALDIAYELEQTDKSFHLSNFEVMAEQQDPHFYSLKLKIINFSPKIQAIATAPEKPAGPKK
jgi:type II secretory pathway component PulM